MHKVFIYLFLCWNSTALRLAPAFDQTGGSSTKDMKLIQLVGDSVDRFMIDDWCEDHKEDGSVLLFGQQPSGDFGQWSYMGQVDETLEKLFKSSNVGAWKTWQGRICVVQKLGITAAFVFNPKGVDTQGPWWHQDVFERWNASLCDLGNPTPDCHDHSLYLGPALRAIQARTQLTPHATVFSSNAWDVDRLRFHQHLPWESFEHGDVQDEWQHNATKLINAIKPIVPNSQIIWHTSALGKENNQAYTFDKIVDQEGLDSGLTILPGSHLGVHAFNSAAHKMCKKENIPVEEWELDNIQYRDAFHPVRRTLVAWMENMVQKYL